jgi:hypothetical protein
VALAGSVTPTGALAKTPQTSHSGTVTPAGALTRQTSTSMAGTVAPAGTLLRRIRIAVAGSIAPTGTVIAEIVTVTPGTWVEGSLTVSTTGGDITPGNISGTIQREHSEGTVTP